MRAPLGPPRKTPPTLEVAATRFGHPRPQLPLAKQDIVNFVLTIRLSHDLPLPPREQEWPKPIPILQLTYYDWIRDILAVQLQVDKKGNILAGYHFLNADTDPIPFPRPGTLHEYRIERMNGQARLYVDNRLVKSGPSQGRQLQDITLPMLAQTRIYSVELVRHTSPPPPSPRKWRHRPATAPAAAPAAQQPPPSTGGGNGGSP